MNRFLAVLAFSGVFLIAAMLSQSVRAQEYLPENQVNQIRQNCVRAQSVLNQLHATDALLRTNRGQIYELISTKLMAPLNSRIALNRLGGLKLAASTLEYDKQLTTFRSSYQQYEESMSETLEINCKEQPLFFYDSVKTTREKRQKLHEDADQLNALLRVYKNDFEDFAKESSKDTK